MKHIFKISLILFSLGLTFLTGCIKEDFDTPPAPYFIFNETFKDSLGSFTQYSVTGAQVWAAAVYSGTTYANMSGYSGSYNANEDWLISKPINFDSYKNETLSFNSATKYGNPGDGSLKLYTSNDYTGTGDPHLATWVEVTPINISLGNFTWVSSGPINLSSVTGAKVYIAFKYLCTTTGVPTWELTKIKLTGEPL
ncbi:MAG: choice-of-anchor J domain-containing protein [Bacteroidia bacterium]|nr:choice-of-anchor J domain-containing protein [Bacteroidia bacterium]